MNRWEGLQLRVLGTSGLSIIMRNPTLVLETTGRRTGRIRRTPVAYLERADGSLLIGGGAAGMSRVDWVANLGEGSPAHVWLRRKHIPVTATRLRGDAEQSARVEAFARWPGSKKYEHISGGRPIPYYELHLKDAPVA
jgi:deazaflavin-dependent oxidoreductase (nitroreductase family)